MNKIEKLNRDMKKELEKRGLVSKRYYFKSTMDAVVFNSIRVTDYGFDTKKRKYFIEYLPLHKDSKIV